MHMHTTTRTHASFSPYARKRAGKSPTMLANYLSYDFLFLDRSQLSSSETHFWSVGHDTRLGESEGETSKHPPTAATAN